MTSSSSSLSSSLRSISSCTNRRLITEVELLDMPIGSLLEFQELPNFLFTHWGVYIGDGLIVHFTPVKKIKLSPSQAVDGIAKINFMREIWPGKKKNVFINNKGDDFNMTPFEPKEIARRAKEQVGRPLIYKLYEFNCEHFANECRYGVKRSFQAEEVKGIKKLMEQYEKAASRFPSWSDEDDEGEQETAAVPMLQMAYSSLLPSPTDGL